MSFSWSKSPPVDDQALWELGANAGIVDFAAPSICFSISA